MQKYQRARRNGGPARAYADQRRFFPRAVELRRHVRRTRSTLADPVRTRRHQRAVVRLAGLPAMLLAPLAGWLVGRRGATRVAVVGLPDRRGRARSGGPLDLSRCRLLVIASVVFVLGIATIVPSVIAMVGNRGGSSRAGALAVNGVAVFAGASCGPLVAQLPIGFTGLMLSLGGAAHDRGRTRRDQQSTNGRRHRLGLSTPVRGLRL